MPDSWLSAVSPSVLSPVKRAALLLLLAALLLAPAAAFGQATPTPRSFVWDQIDVTVELREDGALHVTERDRVAFTGGPFQVGYRDIPLARIERIDHIRVGEVDGEFIRPYRFVAPEQFTRDVPNTFSWQEIGSNFRIDFSIVPATSESRTLQIEYDAYGALGVHADADPPYQEISWIGVDTVLTEFAPVNEASLTVVLPRAIELSEAAVQGPGGDRPADHTADGQTWVWRASELGPGESLQAGLRFPPLADAEAPAWQEASERAGNATPIAAATPVASSPDLPLCRQVIESDFPGQRRELLADCVTERPIFVPENWVFDGGGHVIYARDPAGGVLTGGVIEVTAAGSVVQDTIVDGSTLTAPCQDDDGATFVAGMVFRSGPGSVSGVTVRAMQRELAPGVDAGSASIRLRKSCGIGVVVMGSGPVSINEAVIADVAYAGVVVDSAQASISQTVIDRAEAFGIQVHNGQVRITPGNQIRDGLIGIQIEGGGGGRVAGNTVSGMAKSGIEVIGARVTIADNVVAEVEEAGILMIEGSGAIQGNTVDDAFHGVAVAGGTAGEVVGNTVRRPSDSGIFVSDAGTAVTIADNTVEASTMDGIWVQRGAEASVRDNRVAGAARHGIAAVEAGTRATIAGNAVSDAGTHGIWAGSSEAEITGNEVIDAAENGILLTGGTRATIAENRVSGGQRGIEAGGAGTTATIVNNAVDGVGSPGIAVNGGATASDVSGNTVTGSRFGIVVLGAGTTATVAANTVSDLSGSGFTVESGAAATLRGNHVSRSAWGIAVTGAGTDAELRENRIEETETLGISIEEGARATVAGNTLLQPGMNGIEIDEAGHVSLEGNAIEDARSNGIRFQRVRAAAPSTSTVVLVSHDIYYDPTEIAIPPNTAVTLTLPNEGAIAHNVTIEALDIDVDIAPGETEQIVVNAPAGTYEMFCNVPGHREAGQVGTLIVLPGAELDIDADDAADSTGPDVIRDNEIDGGETGIFVTGAGANVAVTGSRIADTAGQGIRVQGGAEATLMQNVVQRAGSDGIAIDGRGTAATVEGNIIGQSGENGIKVERAAAATISHGNVVSDGEWGISILSAGTVAEVRGNEVYNADNQGIAVVYGAQAVIAFNTVRGGDSGIYIRFEGSSAVITNNTVEAERRGIHVWEEATAEWIAGNIVRESASGIVIEGEGVRATIEENRVFEFGREGIAVRDGANAEVKGNSVRRNRMTGSSWGILVAGPGSAAVVSGNEVADMDGVGIQISDGADGEVRDNAVSDVHQVGIRAMDAPTGVEIRGNTVRGAGQIGIEARLSEAVIAENTVEGATFAGIQLGGGDTEATGNTIVGPAEPEADAPGPFGIQVQGDASGLVAGNRISGLTHGGAACAIHIDADAPAIRLADNRFPSPGNDREICDERLSPPAATPAPAATPVPAPIADAPCLGPAELRPNVAVVTMRTAMMQKGPRDPREPRHVLARGTRLLVAPAVMLPEHLAAAESCGWVPVVVVETGQPGFVMARHLQLADPAP